MGMGLFAFALRYLSPLQAACCAVVAIVHNLWLFPRYGMRKLERPEEKARGYSGMIGYPFIVMVLILLCLDFPTQMGLSHPSGSPDASHFYREKLAIAAGAWALLTFGDAFGALCGMFLKGPALPWNGSKRWSGFFGFIVFGAPLSCLAICFVSDSIPGDVIGVPELAIFVTLAAFCSAVIESFPGQIDDNLTVPLMAWVVLSFLPEASFRSLPETKLAIVIALAALNVALGSTAYFLKMVDLSSYLLGLLFGFCVILGSGPAGYGILVLFYVVSQSSTYYGKETKKARKIEEPEEGMRKTGSVFSKGFIPALFSLLSVPSFVAALAVYAADTVASEVGKTSKSQAFSLLTFKRVAPGTVGAVSWKGSIAGILTILAFWSASLWLFSLAFGADFIRGQGILLGNQLTTFRLSGSHLDVAVAILPAALIAVCFFLESVINEWNSKRNFFSKEMIHLFLGATAGMVLYLPNSLISLASYYLKL